MEEINEEEKKKLPLTDKLLEEKMLSLTNEPFEKKEQLSQTYESLKYQYDRHLNENFNALNIDNSKRIMKRISTTLKIKTNENVINEKNSKVDNSEYFWKSDQDLFWCPYYFGISSYLEKEYQCYINNEGPAEINLGDEYKINFKEWTEISNNPDRKINIMRGWRERINFVAHRKRWGIMNNFNRSICNTNGIMDPSSKDFQKNICLFKWEVGNDKIDLMIPKEMNFFKNKILKMNLETYIQEIKKEIKELSIESEFQNKIKPYDFSDDFDRLEKDPSSLYSLLVLMYIKETFLYAELNKLLRTTQNHLNYGYKIKYYYIGFMAALQKLTNQTKMELEQQYFQEKNKIIKTYRGEGISKKDLDFLQINKGVLIPINSFLSTSINKEVAENFMERNSTSSSYKALFEFDIPVSDNPPFTFFAQQFDIFGEREVLIHNGSYIEIVSIIENPINQFNIKGKIISNGWKGYFQYFSMNLNQKTLNLSHDFSYQNKENILLLKNSLIATTSLQTLYLQCNFFGKLKKYKMQLLKEALIENKSIKILYLNHNGLGQGDEDIMQLLTEGLLQNQNIEIINLGNNGFGIGKKENMQHLKNLIIRKKNLLTLYLYTNNFGEGEEEIMQILMEGLIASTSIQTLYLLNNGFGKGKTANMKILQEIIEKNLSIKNLYLHYNGFGVGKVENMEALKEGLIKNKCIQTLDLNANDLGIGNKEIIQFFQEIIIKNNSIKTFHLKENGFGEDVLKETFMRNKGAQTLYLSGNDLDVQAENNLKNCLFGINLIFDYNI